MALSCSGHFFLSLLFVIRKKSTNVFCFLTPISVFITTAKYRGKGKCRLVSLVLQCSVVNSRFVFHVDQVRLTEAIS